MYFDYFLFAVVINPKTIPPGEIVVSSSNSKRVLREVRRSEAVPRAVVAVAGRS